VPSAGVVRALAFDRSKRTTFDQVAQFYDEARPGYPGQLVEDVIALSGIPPDGRILEIGCGPGKATIPFAQKGYGMLCLELGAELAALTVAKCKPYPNVQVRNISFEEWPVERAAFDLVISAQAFHWIDPEIGYAKAAASLKDSGSIALFWNRYPPSDTALRRSLADVYRTRAPQLVTPKGKGDLDALIEDIVDDIDASGLFGQVTVKRYPWSQEYTADQYIKLLNTYSDHRSLDERIRRDLFAGVQELIKEYGGPISRPYLAVLYLASKRTHNAVSSSG
jgi:SAM-dependent methyltransferase